MKTTFNIVITILFFLINISSSKSQNTNINSVPINQLNREQCFTILDRMVKANNGKQLTAKNFIQYQASFTSDGFGIITDEEMGYPLGKKLFVYKLIKWEALKSINIKKLNFKHSCICLKFPEGFYPYWQVYGLDNVRCIRQIPNGDFKAEYEKMNCSNELKKDILNNPNPSSIDENIIDAHSKEVKKPYITQDTIWIIVNNEDANKFVEVIKRISIIEREKTKNFKLKLFSEERWYGNILKKWHVDSEGNFQGRFEEYNSKGELVTFGEYKNNTKVGKWVIKGEVKIFPLFDDNCYCKQNWSF